MRLLVSTYNLNCYLALYQSCKKYDIECLKFDDIDIKDIKEDDVVIYLESIFKSYKTLRCRVINKAYFSEELMDKYSQYTIIKKSGLNCIPTFTYSEFKNMKIVVPFIAKPKRGSMGDNVKLLQPNDDLSNLNDLYIFQPFIKNDGDWRITVVDNRAVSMIKRKGTGFLNNIAKGAMAWSDYDYKASELAEKCSKYLNAEYCGIDIIKCENTGIYYFLESNITPTFDTSQILTKIDVSNEIVHYIKRVYS